MPSSCHRCYFVPSSYCLFSDKVPNKASYSHKAFFGCIKCSKNDLWGSPSQPYYTNNCMNTLLNGADSDKLMIRRSAIFYNGINKYMPNTSAMPGLARRTQFSIVMFPVNCQERADVPPLCETTSCKTIICSQS